MHYKIHQVGVLSAAKIGFVVGMIVGALPTLFGALAIALSASWLHQLIAGWQQVEIITPLLSQSITVNFVEKFGLGGLLGSLDTLSNVWMDLLLFLIGILLSGSISAGLGALAAFAYNNVSAWTGGLEVTLQSFLADASAQPQPAAGVAGLPAQQAAPLPPPQPRTVPSSSPGPTPQPARPLAPLPAAQQAHQPPFSGQPPVAASPGPAYAPSAASPSTRPVQVAPQAAAALQPTPVNIPPLPTASGPRLVLASNPSQIWLIDKPVFTIGSSQGSGLYAGGLAPHHAEIRFDPANQAYLLRDLSNGQVMVNGRPIQTVNKLKDGFQIRVGPIELIFHC